MKIVGYTVGTPLPKPNLKQTDPTKGDYVKGKEILDEKYIKVDEQELTEEQKVQVRMNIGAGELASKDEVTKTELSADVQASLDKADAALEFANAYTDDAVARKTQVQIVSDGNSEVMQTLKIYRLTQEEYDQAMANGTLEENALYLTPDEEFDLDGYVTIEQLKTKADLEHNHDDLYYAKSEIDTKLDEIDLQKSQVQIITWGADD